MPFDWVEYLALAHDRYWKQRRTSSLLDDSFDKADKVLHYLDQIKNAQT
jgi:hypothetical protein